MNIFEFALQMEKDGETYYRELADKSGEKGLKTIFTMLADDEVKHYQVVQGMMKNQKATMADTTVLSKAKNIFAEMKSSGKHMDLGVSHITLYKHAQENEKKSEDFYRDKANEASDATIKAIMLKLAEEEKRHYFLLENIIDFVNRPDTWLENAEFNHLETY